MEDLDLDFGVTYNGQYILIKEKGALCESIAKSSLRQLIAYAKRSVKKSLLEPSMPLLGSKNYVIWSRLLFPNWLVVLFRLF